MKQDPFALALLFDYYGDLLTEKQRTCFDLYYNQDLSLAEIAEEGGISRQGVHDSLSRAEAALRMIEEKIGCVGRDLRVHKAAEEIIGLAKALEGSADENVCRLGLKIRTLAEEIKE